MPIEDDFPPLPVIPTVSGVHVSGVVAGLKDNDKHDLFIAKLINLVAILHQKPMNSATSISVLKLPV